MEKEPKPFSEEKAEEIMAETKETTEGEVDLKKMSEEREATFEAGYSSRVKKERNGFDFTTLPFDYYFYGDDGEIDLKVEAAAAVEIARHLKEGDHLRITRRNGEIGQGAYVGIDTLDGGGDGGVIKIGDHYRVRVSSIARIEKQNL